MKLNSRKWELIFKGLKHLKTVSTTEEAKEIEALIAEIKAFKW